MALAQNYIDNQIKNIKEKCLISWKIEKIQKINNDPCFDNVKIIIKNDIWYYKVFTKEKKWSKWSKNGMTSGNDYSIRNIKIKCKKDSFSVMYYTDGDWSLKSNNKTINGIKIVNTGYFLEKYDVCYRTYNKKSISPYW